MKAIVTRVLGETTKRCRRIKASAGGGKYAAMTINYPMDVTTDFEAHAVAVKELVRKLEWAPVMLNCGQMNNGDYVWTIIEKKSQLWIGS